MTGLAMEGTLSQKRSGYFTFCLILVALTSAPSAFAWTMFAALGVSLKSQLSSACPLPARHPTTWTATCPVDFQQHIFEAAQEPTESFDSPFSLVQVWNVEWEGLHTSQDRKPRISGVHPAGFSYRYGGNN